MHSALYPDVPVWMRISDKELSLGYDPGDAPAPPVNGHMWSADEIWYMLEALEEKSSYADVDRALQLGRGCAYGKHLRMIESGEIEE